MVTTSTAFSLAMGFFALPLRFYGAHTALSRHSHYSEIVKLLKRAVHTHYERVRDAAQSPYKAVDNHRVHSALSLRSCCGVGDATELLRSPYCDPSALLSERRVTACSKCAPSVGALVMSLRCCGNAVAMFAV
jgi:hypothetical protein